MKEKCRAFRALKTAVICFGISALSISAIYPAGRLKGRAGQITDIAIALLFWLGLILAAILLVYAARSLRIGKRGLPGLFRFRRKNIWMYVVIGCGLLFLVCDLVFRRAPGWLAYPVLSVTLFFTELHGVIDGSCYQLCKDMKVGADHEN